MFWSYETAYNGTVYRSRTEARYAVAFDHAGIEFQYEPDGYLFEEGGRSYVPDFWVPAWSSFLEVKPDWFTLTPGEWPDERCKCEVLNEATKKDVLLACGSPSLSRILNVFQADRLGWQDVYLANYLSASAILAGKRYRFDWRKEPREKPRPIYTGDGVIGDVVRDLIPKFRPRGNQ